eukprot:TRINITY_DN19740_c0_g1_i1.p1 TRINITY_DN19740_c0_g1~~TRINITY_DN19740_c0_g1_i1.p1  ORF type:complete len:797 (+),score=255.39 TRINITY_DN19740_c0_g1_i1:305-2392(+)
MAEQPRWVLARAVFARGEYVRAAGLLAQCSSPRPFFLHCYALYLAGEERKEEALMRGGRGAARSAVNPNLDKVLERTATPECGKDPYFLWLRGVCLRHKGRRGEASAVQVRAAKLQPVLRAVWQELQALGAVSEAAAAAGQHWAAKLALADVAGAQHDWSQALSMWADLEQVLGSSNPTLLRNTATARRHQRQWHEARRVFTQLATLQPYRIDFVVDYADVLFVTWQTSLAELRALACRVYQHTRYRPESCMVLGDYFASVGKNAAAYACFERAWRLDPAACPNAPVLMAQEAVEGKLLHEVISAFRTAIESSGDAVEADRKRLSVARSGLGTMYELVGLDNAALVHHCAAARVPGKARVGGHLTGAIRNVFLQMNEEDEATRCLFRTVGDPDDPLVRLYRARASAKRGDAHKAAELYLRHLEHCGYWPPPQGDPKVSTLLRPESEEAIRAVVGHWMDQGRRALESGPEDPLAVEHACKILRDAEALCDFAAGCETDDGPLEIPRPRVLDQKKDRFDKMGADIRWMLQQYTGQGEAFDLDAMDLGLFDAAEPQAGRPASGATPLPSRCRKQRPAPAAGPATPVGAATDPPAGGSAGAAGRRATPVAAARVLFLGGAGGSPPEGAHQPAGPRRSPQVSVGAPPPLAVSRPGDGGPGRWRGGSALLGPLAAPPRPPQRQGSDDEMCDEATKRLDYDF